MPCARIHRGLTLYSTENNSHFSCSSSSTQLYDDDNVRQTDRYTQPGTGQRVRTSTTTTRQLRGWQRRTAQQWAQAQCSRCSTHTLNQPSASAVCREEICRTKNKSKCHMLLLLPIDTSRWSCHRWPPPPAPAPPVYANCQLLEPD